MSTRSINYWGKLSKMPFKNENFSRKEELGVELTMFISQNINRRHRLILFTRSIAAIFVLIILSGLAYISSEVVVKSDLYSTRWVLPDGSEIFLSAESEVRYNRISWFYSRQLTLKGSAEFSVTKGSKFKVHTFLADIEVLGTVFDIIELDNGRMQRVSCQEGSVKVSTGDSTQVLNPGDSVEVTEQSFLYKPKIEDSYTFNGVPLSNVIVQMEKCFEYKFEMEDSVRDILFSGVIPTEDIHVALLLLSKSCNINYRIRNNIVYLYK